MAPSAVIETKKALDCWSNATPSGLPAGSGCSVNSRSVACAFPPPLPLPGSAEATVTPHATATAAESASINQRWNIPRPPEVGLLPVGHAAGQTSRPYLSRCYPPCRRPRLCGGASVERDDDLAGGAALLDVGQRLEGLVEREGPGDDRAEVAGVVEHAQLTQLGSVGLHEQERVAHASLPGLLADLSAQQPHQDADELRRAELVGEPGVRRTSHADRLSAGLEDRQRLLEVLATERVQHEVVAGEGFGEVLLPVVHDDVGTEPAQQ